jgi:hypothetical protein
LAFGDVDIPPGPLFHRDIEKTDRQDDNAATRLFSSAALEHLVEHRPQELGQIAYMFIFGELVDAWQNRSLPHDERILMALRAWYFLEMWVTYLDRVERSKRQYCISPEAIDIVRTLVASLISLVVIYRDDERFKDLPLLLWKYATEVLEHIFGILRKLIPNFTMLDFIYAVPRLHILVRAAMRRASAPSEAKSRASGYAHTYADYSGMKLDVLSQWPSDVEICSVIPTKAYQQAANLWYWLGTTPAALIPGLARPYPNPSTGLTHPLPSVASWFADMTEEDSNDSSDESDLDEDSDEDVCDPEDSYGGADSLYRIIKYGETHLKGHDERLQTLTSAALSLTVDERLWMQVLS